mgnify:CR=1 FL=1
MAKENAHIESTIGHKVEETWWKMSHKITLETHI